jgi:glycine cleavage system H lipoate-binding protein
MDPNRLETRLSQSRAPCIWMQAAVVPHKFCERDYDCPDCRYDKAMQRVSEENKRSCQKTGKRRTKIVSWRDKLQGRPAAKRACIHHMKGRINFKACMNDYRCGHCEFDQFFSDQFAVHALVKPVDLFEIEGFKVPQGYYFHQGHMWAKIEEGASVRVGLDDFALRLLGPFDRIEAPLMGKEVKQDRPDTILARDVNRAKVLSPVSGVVTSINPKLREKGYLANRDAYADGWVMTVHSSDLRRDLKNLMIHTETKDFFKSEVERLYQVIEDTGGPLSADGGQLGNDIYGKMPQMGWKRLTRLFLRT